jgi:hypothetical protein
MNILDPREGHKVKHDLLTLVRQRLFAIAQGYEDNNDAATLAKDPAFKIMAGKAPESDGDLASQPTLSRFENRVTTKDLRHLSDRLLELYLKTHLGPRKVIVIDMDATDDPTHGKQQLSFFHGYYEEHMYHPLLVFDGRDGFPLAAVLRRGNTHSSCGALAVLTRLIQKLRQAYPKALILFRADAGFAVPALYSYLEDQPETRYVIGFITNNRLLALSWQRRNASRRGRNNGSSPPSAIRRNPGTSPGGSSPRWNILTWGENYGSTSKMKLGF